MFTVISDQIKKIFRNHIKMGVFKEINLIKK